MKARAGNQHFRLAFGDQRKVEDVTNRDAVTPVSHFFGDDFDGGFHPYQLSQNSHENGAAAKSPERIGAAMLGDFTGHR